MSFLSQPHASVGGINETPLINSFSTTTSALFKCILAHFTYLDMAYPVNSAAQNAFRGAMQGPQGPTGALVAKMTLLRTTSPNIDKPRTSLRYED